MPLVQPKYNERGEALTPLHGVTRVLSFDELAVGMDFWVNDGNIWILRNQFWAIRKEHWFSANQSTYFTNKISIVGGGISDVKFLLYLAEDHNPDYF